MMEGPEDKPAAVPGADLKRNPRPELWHHVVAFAFPLLCVWASFGVGGSAALGRALLALGSAHVFLVAHTWIQLPRPTAAVANTLLGVALEPIRSIAVPIALFGLTTVVAAQVGAAVGKHPNDLELSASAIAWFFGAASLVVLLVAVPYVYWRASLLRAKHLKKARRRLARPVENPFRRDNPATDVDTLAARPVSEYLLWLATSRGGRNLMLGALVSLALGMWIYVNEGGG